MLSNNCVVSYTGSEHGNDVRSLTYIGWLPLKICTLK